MSQASRIRVTRIKTKVLESLQGFDEENGFTAIEIAKALSEVADSYLQYELSQK